MTSHFAHIQAVRLTFATASADSKVIVVTIHALVFVFSLCQLLVTAGIEWLSETPWLIEVCSIILLALHFNVFAMVTYMWAKSYANGKLKCTLLVRDNVSWSFIIMQARVKHQLCNG